MNRVDALVCRAVKRPIALNCMASIVDIMKVDLLLDGYHLVSYDIVEVYME